MKDKFPYFPHSSTTTEKEVGQRTFNNKFIHQYIHPIAIEIAYEDAVSIRIQLVGHYGKTGYYRFYRGERGLMPKDQAYIRQLFRNKGIKKSQLTNITQKNILVSCCHLSPV